MTRLTKCRVWWCALVLAAVAVGSGAAFSAEVGSLAYSFSRRPPGNAVVLFDGSDLSGWHHAGGEPAAWKVENGAMTIGRGNILSQETFQDAWVHIEFRIPDMPGATGQAKGNSGVYLQGRYEIQVLDSYGFKSPGKGDCGAIYGLHAPLVNACKPPLYWQSFDIFFRAPRLEAGQVKEPGRMTVLQNGIVIHNNAEVPVATAAGMAGAVDQPGPLMLQDHGCPVQYRQIWLVHLPAKGSDSYGPQ